MADTPRRPSLFGVRTEKTQALLQIASARDRTKKLTGVSVLNFTIKERRAATNEYQGLV